MGITVRRVICQVCGLAFDEDEAVVEYNDEGDMELQCPGCGHRVHS